MISKEQIEKVVQTIAEGYKPEKIILFGSYAYGNPTEDSDLDLLIIKETELPRHKRAREVRRFFRGWQIPLDLLVYTKEEIEKWETEKNSFVFEVVSEGKVIYG